MSRLTNSLLIFVVLVSQLSWAAASAGAAEAALGTTVCEHVGDAAPESVDSHQACSDHDCHASAHYLAVVSSFMPFPAATAQSPLATAIKQYLSYRAPPPTQPPRSLS